MFQIDKSNFESFLLEFDQYISNQTNAKPKVIKYPQLGSELIRFYESYPEKNEESNRRINLLKTMIFEGPSKATSLIEGRSVLPISLEMSFKADNRFLLHVCGGRLGEKSGLEGTSFLSILKNFNQYLDAKLRSPNEQRLKLYNLQELVNTAIEIESQETIFNQAILLLHKISLIPQGTSLLIPGGWTDTPPEGHAIYYFLTKHPTDPKKVLFKLFNLGDGVEIEQNGLDLEGKVKREPYSEWEVPIEKLQDIYNLIALVELKTLMTVERFPTRYHNKDIYQGLKSIFGATSIRHEGFRTHALPMACQESGVCPWRSFSAFLRVYLEDDSLYKNIKCEIKLQALESYISFSQPELSDYHLVEEVISDLSMSIDKYYDEGVVDEAGLKQALHLMTKAKSFLKRFESRGHSHAIPDTFQCEPLSQTLPTSQSSIPLIKSRIVGTMIDHYEIFDKFLVLSRKPEDIANTLSEAIRLAERHSIIHDNLRLNLSLENLILELPCNMDFWKLACNQNPEIAKKYMSDLGTIARYYMRSFCYLTDRHVGRAHYIFVRLQKINEVLLKRDNKFEAFKLVSFDDIKYLQIECSSARDQDLFKREINEKGQNFVPYITTQQISNSPSVHIFRFTGAPSLRVLEKICPLIPGSKLQMEADLWTNQDIPVWLSSIRDIAIYLAWLRSGDFTFQENLSVEEFKPQFKLRSENTESIRYTISIGRKLDLYRSQPINLNVTARRVSIDIQKVLCLDLAEAKEKEKQILHENSAKKLSEEEFSELRHLKASSSLQLIRTLAYFEKYPEKFQHSEYQNFFRVLIFQPSLLEDEIKSNPQFPYDLAHFFEITEAYFRNNHLLEPLCFIAEMKFKLSQFSTVIDYSPNAYRHFLKEIMGDSLLKAELRTLAFLQFIASFRESKVLTEEEMDLILRGYYFEKKFPFQPANYELLYEIKEVKVRLESQLTSYLQNDKHQSRILGDLFQMEFPEERSRKWTPERNCTFSSDQFLVYPLEGFVCRLNNEIPLPSIFLENETFATLFPNQKKGRQIGNSLFYFVDKYGIETVVKIDFRNNLLHIEQKRDGKWLRYQSQSSFIQQDAKTGVISCLFDNLFLTLEYSHWITVKGEACLYIVNSKTGDVEWKKEAASHLKEVSTGRYLAKPEFFHEFEHPLYIKQYVSHDKELLSVELPRFKLSFQAKDGEFFCDQFPGFKVSLEMHPKCLRGYRHVILLENSKREQKVLIPFQEFAAPLKYASLEPKFEREQELNATRVLPQSFCVYQVKNSELKGTTFISQLYLAQVLFLMRNYEGSAKLLEQAVFRTTKLIDKELEILRAISRLNSVNGDNSPNARGIRVYASYLILKNEEKWNASAISHEDLAMGAKNYISYQQLAKRVTCLLLTPLQKKFFDRLNEMARAPSTPAKTTAKKLLKKKLKDALTVEPGEYQITAFTRLPEIEDRFTSYYSLAKSCSSLAKAHLETALEFYQEDLLAQLLAAVVKQPDAFPDLPDPDTLFETYLDWIKKVSKIAMPLMRQTTTPRPAICYGVPTLKISQEIPVSMTVLKVRENIPAFQINLTKLIVEKPLLEDREDLGDYEAFLNKIGSEWERLRQDFKYYQAHVKPTSLYEIPDLAIIEKQLPGTFSCEVEIEIERANILKMANHSYEDMTQSMRRTLSTISGAFRPFTMDELIVYFARKDRNALLRRNPALTSDEAEEILNRVGNYLITATELQKIRRISTLISQLKDSTSAEEAEEFRQQVAREILLTRNYTIQEHPEYLLIEYYLNSLIRKDQLENLELYLKTKDRNLLSQMIMGFGKSTLFLPLLSILLADGKSLVGIVVPSALLESTAEKTQETLKPFRLLIHTFHFERHSSTQVDNLENILDELQFAVDNRQPVIMTNKSLKSFILRYIETYIAEGSKAKETVVMKEIFRLFHNGTIIIDEVDSVLNVFHEVMFSLGDSESIDALQLETMRAIYSLIYSDPELKAMARVESDPEPNSIAPYFTESKWYEYRELLLQKLMLRLQTLQLDSEISTEQVQEFARRIEPSLISALWSESRDQKAKARELFSKQPSTIRLLALILEEEFSAFLSHSLIANNGQQYGLIPESHFAIPFAAVNTPSKGSQFANCMMTVNYSFQAYAKGNISDAIIREELARLQRSALKEMRHKQCTLYETKAWRLFYALHKNKSLPLFNMTSAQYDIFSKAINATLETKLLFVSSLLLPRLPIFNKKITCNPHHFVGLLGKVIGFTGTLWNQSSLHHKLEPRPVLGTDTKTLAILWKKNRSDTALSLKEESIEERIEELYEQQPNLALLADSGGEFRVENQKLSDLIRKRFQKPVAFYSQEGILLYMETDGSVTKFSESVRDEQRYIVYLDQANTIGRDVKYHDTAISVVTIGKNMILRDLLQAVWRLRKLDKRQKVRFALSDEVENIIQQRYGNSLLESILRFVIDNQEERVVKEIGKAIAEELPSIYQTLLIKATLHPNISNEQADAIADEIKAVWIVTPNSKDKTPHSIEEAKTSAITSIEGLYSKFPWLETLGFKKDDAINEVHQTIKKIPSALSVKFMIEEDECNASMEMEQMAQKEMESQLEQEESVEEGDKPFALIEWESLQPVSEIDEAKDLLNRMPNCLPILPLKAFLEEKFPEVAQAFEGIDFSFNVFNWQKKDFSDLHLFGKKRIPLDFVLHENNKLVVLSQREAIVFKSEGKDVRHVTLHSHLATGKEFVKYVKLKFLNGECDFRKEERKVLKAWFEEIGAIKMQNFYEKFILLGFPMKRHSYRSSSLRKLFKKMMLNK